MQEITVYTPREAAKSKLIDFLVGFLIINGLMGLGILGAASVSAINIQTRIFSGVVGPIYIFASVYVWYRAYKRHYSLPRGVIFELLLFFVGVFLLGVAYI